MVISSGNNYLVRFRRDASFLNKPIIKRQLEEIPEGSFVLIDISRADFIDPDVIEVIQDFQKSATLKNIDIEIKQNIFSKQKIEPPTA